VYRWDGTSWTNLWGQAVSAMAVLPNGDLVAAGQWFVPIGYTRVARWDGTNWSAVGTLPGTVNALAVAPNGDIIAAGAWPFGSTIPASVARWNGTAWTPVGSGMSSPAYGVTTLANGDILAAIDTSSAMGNGMVRWNGTSWSPLGGGTSHRAYVVRSLPSGDVLAGGQFGTAGTQASPYFARMRSAAPATATPYGSGCSGSAGPVTLVATQLPWLGSTFRASALGLPLGSLAVGVFGSGAMSVPLAALLPQGTPGCMLLATPDLLELIVPASGTAETAFAVPNAPILIGQSFRCQTVVVELGAAGLSAVTSTNGLTLTIGLL
jgi:hypothetical protein